MEGTDRGVRLGPEDLEGFGFRPFLTEPGGRIMAPPTRARGGAAGRAVGVRRDAEMNGQGSEGLRELLHALDKRLLLSAEGVHLALQVFQPDRELGPLLVFHSSPESSANPGDPGSYFRDAEGS